MTQIQTASQTRPVRFKSGQIIGRILEPPFMRRINTRLIREQPWLWSMRLHHALYFAFLLNFVGLSLVALAPLHNPAQISGFVNTTVWLLIILQVAAMLIWRHGQDRFHVVREAGRRYDKTGWREFFGYLFALILLMSSLPIFLGGIQQRIGRMDAEMVSADLLLLRVNNRFATVNSQSDTKTGNEVVDEALSALHERPLSHLLNTSEFFFSYLEETEFIAGMGESAEIGALRNMTSHQLIERVALYSGATPSEIEAVMHQSVSQYWSENDDYADYSGAAYHNVQTLFQLGFDNSQRFVLISWLVTFALAVHFSMVRLLYKYSSQRGIIILTAVFLGALFVNWFGGFFFGVMFYWLDDSSMSIPALLFIALTAYFFAKTARIPTLERFNRWRAIQLMLLPIMFGLLPFAFVLLAESLSNFNFLSDHFFDSSPYFTWSVYPFGGWILYAAQFTYVPLIPFLKRRFVRLEMLPRN